MLSVPELSLPRPAWSHRNFPRVSVTGLVHVMFERMSFDHCRCGRCVLAVAGSRGGGRSPPLSWSSCGVGDRDEEDPRGVATCSAPS